MARWGEVVRQILLQQTAKRATNARRQPVRVSATLRNADQQAYVPHFVSLGPNHFRKPETESLYEDLMIMSSTNEGYKLKSAATLWHKLMKIQTKRLSLDDLVNDIEVMRPHIESFYDWSNTADDNEYRNDLSLMMALDSFFILQILFGHDRRAHGIQIKCDILKLENQIPLCVLKHVFDKVKKALLHPDLHRDICCSQEYAAIRMNRLLLQKAYKELSPFDTTPDDIQVDDTVEGQEPHLLGCIHAIVSRFLQIQHDAQDGREAHLIGCIPKPTRTQIISNFLQVRVLEKMCRLFFFPTYKPGGFPIKGYTAHELAKAGIKFKSFSGNPSQRMIWFDKYSQILYLPQMTVTSPTQTEVFFKNLLAFEFNDHAALDNRPVRHFIQLMDALIDTSLDVRRLRKSHVICLGSALSDKDLAKIWDSMHKPFSSGHLEPPEELKQALDDVLTTKCCIIKCRIKLSEHFTNILSLVLRHQMQN